MSAQFTTLTSADRRAAYAWLARRDKNSTPEFELSLQRWLAEKPQHRRAYDEASQLWRLLREPAARVAERDDCRERLKPQRTIPAFAGWAVAACAVLVVGLSIWLKDPAFVQDWRADVTTRRGESLSYALPDGSTVVLGADTALALDFSEKGHRNVEVLRGQAFFRVKPGLEARFIVSAGESQVEVTGTTFDIDNQGDDVSVTVETGSVKVVGDRSEHFASLGPSEKVVVEGGKVGGVSKVDLNLELGWMRGQVVFDRRPLSRIIATLQRYIPATIVVRGSTGAQIVSGSFPTDSAEETLRALAATVGTRAHNVTPWIIVIF